MKKYLLVLFLLLFINEFGICYPIQVKVIFPYFFSPVIISTVKIAGGFNSWDTTITMQKINDTTFIYDTNYLNNCTFSVNFWLPIYRPYPWWINTRSGICYSKVYLNNQRINSTYLVDNDFHNGANFSFFISSTGTITSYGTPLPIDTTIPAEVAHVKDTIEYGLTPNHFTVPYTRVQSWMQLIHNNDYPDSSSKVEVDYIKLYSLNYGGGQTLLYYNEFKYKFDSINHGGLYIRYPFFGNDTHLPMRNYTVDTNLVIYPSLQKYRVWHCWDTIRTVIDTHIHKGYKIEARVKITGRALVQTGIDYWLNSSTTNGDTNFHREVGTSNWIKASPNWQILEFNSQSISAIEPNNEMSNNYTLFQNYPNPFNPSTKIRFSIPFSMGMEKQVTSLKIYNVLGLEIAVLLNDYLNYGNYEVFFDGSNYPSGIYFYTLQTGDLVESKKMLLIK
jgi:hypothetical protein